MDPFKPYQPKIRAPAIPKLNRDDAAALALKAVVFLANDDSLLSRFVALTGCGLDDFRARINDDVFLGAVLDFLLADEPSLIAFAEAEDLAPETPALARMALGGG